MKAPIISVVTLTWNSAKYLDAMLSTLFEDAARDNIDIEVFMVDNGSTDGSQDIIRRYQDQHDNLTLIPLSRNMGTTVPRNIAIRMARGEHILILDSDTEIPPGALSGLLNATSQIPERDSVGIICPRLIYPGGEFQESARCFPTLMTKVYRLFGMESRRQANETLPGVVAGEITTVDCAMSAAWLVPRSTFDSVGLLDERIFYAPEDVEFCARVWRSGLKVWYWPHTEIVHNWQRITNKKPLSRLGLSHIKGLLRYWWEYDSFFTRPSATSSRSSHKPPAKRHQHELLGSRSQ